MNPLGHAAKSHVNGLWDEPRIALLTKLYAEGLTHGQIATRFAEQSANFRPTRNAIIGKVNRLIDAGMLAHRGDNKIAARRAIRASTARTKPQQYAGSFAAPRNLLRDTRAALKPPNNHDAKVRPPKVEVDMTGGTSETARPWLTRLDHECRAPIGDPTADMRMCCARNGFGYKGDYCERHADAFYKATPRQNDERLAKRFS